MSKTSMSIRLDSEVKEQAQQVFNHLGMDMTTAINIFLRQAIQYQGLPFDVNGGFACLRFAIINSLKKILSWQ